MLLLNKIKQLGQEIMSSSSSLSTRSSGFWWPMLVYWLLIINYTLVLEGGANPIIVYYVKLINSDQEYQVKKSGLHVSQYSCHSSC
jgi:hypothetical protein